MARLQPTVCPAAGCSPPMILRTLAVGFALVAGLFAQAQVADTQFSIRRGLFTNPITVTVSSATPGATIRYTLDCSDPRTSTNFAQGPSPLSVTIDPTSTNAGLRPLTPAVVLRAYAFAPGMTPTNVDTQTYVFPVQVLTQTRPTGFSTAIQYGVDANVVNSPLYSGRILGDLAALPTMSVVGNYTQIFGSSGLLRAANGTIEVPGSIEVMHPDGRRDQVDCGLTPHSWTQNKRSIRVYFRSQYGADKWRHDLFRESPEGHAVGVKSFDGLVLRAGFNDGLLYNDPARAGRYSFAVDDLGRHSQIAMTGFGARGLFVHLYLNGLYWGLYNPIERPESSYWSDYFGGSKHDYFARNHGGPVDGDPAWFNGLIATAASWTSVQTRLDIPSWCDYILYWTYCGGGDWPSFNGNNNNWYAGNRMLPTPGKVRFFVWDCEDSWINLPSRPGPPSDGARIVAELLNGPRDISILWRGCQNVADFRLQWADRVYRQVENDGPLAPAQLLQRWNRITDIVDRGVVGESMRWGRFDPRGVTWTRNNDWLPYTQAIRSMFVNNPARLLAALRNIAVPVPHPALYPSIDPPLFQIGNPAQTIRVSEAWVAAGTQIDIVRPGASGTVYYTLNGGDPRGAGGLPVGQTAGSGTAIIVNATTNLRARTLFGTEWSALHELQLLVRSNLPLVEIAEVVAANSKGLQDEFGQFEDWVELHNRGLVDVDLTGYHLTDNFNQPTKWTFPAGSVIPAGGQLVVFADDEPNQGPLHATFRLSASGERIGLYAPGGAVAVDQFVFGPQVDDESVGRLDSMPGLLVNFPRPTPYRRNRPNPCGHINYRATDGATTPLRLRGVGVPVQGETLRYEIEDVPVGAPAVLGIGVLPQHQLLPSVGTVLVDPLLFLFGVVASDGEARYSLDLVDLPSVRGAVFYAQGGVVLPNGLQLTQGVCSRICR